MECKTCHAFNLAVELAKLLGIQFIQDTFEEAQLEGFRRHVVREHQSNPAIFWAEIPA
jgi:hypothetical protein